MPRVSICLPNLNTRPFLEERFATIAAQTLSDWELLIYDSHSDDGSWELLQSIAARDRRVTAWQGPRAGTPGSWTPCIQQARGEFVYIATSDDTMAPDCLEKLVLALDAHPECELAHCTLRPIDERGRDLTDRAEWWREASIFAQSSGPLLERPHIRRAPFDGLLHLPGGSVYVSVTQLLIRRSLFERIGYFESTWGSVGDFNWSMRAGLSADTVHVPDTWGGWRVHSNQATAAVDLQSREHARRIDAMIRDAVARCERNLPARVRERLATRWLGEAEALRRLTMEMGARAAASAASRRGHLLRQLCRSAAAWEYAVSRLAGASPADWVSRRFASCGRGAALEPV
jgi:glycosyltransferase involved in cell wall biosynthesis